MNVFDLFKFTFILLNVSRQLCKVLFATNINVLDKTINFLLNPGYAVKKPSDAPYEFRNLYHQPASQNSQNQNSLHPIVVNQAKPIQNQFKSNKFQYQTFPNSELKHQQYRKTTTEKLSNLIKSKQV